MAALAEYFLIVFIYSQYIKATENSISRPAKTYPFLHIFLLLARKSLFLFILIKELVSSNYEGRVKRKSLKTSRRHLQNTIFILILHLIFFGMRCNGICMRKLGLYYFLYSNLTIISQFSHSSLNQLQPQPNIIKSYL